MTQKGARNGLQETPNRSEVHYKAIIRGRMPCEDIGESLSLAEPKV